MEPHPHATTAYKSKLVERAPPRYRVVSAPQIRAAKPCEREAAQSRETVFCMNCALLVGVGIIRLLAAQLQSKLKTLGSAQCSVPTPVCRVVCVAVSGAVMVTCEAIEARPPSQPS